MLIWLVPGMRPNDWADVRRGLQYAGAAATLGILPGPTEAVLGGAAATGMITGRTGLALGAGGYFAGIGLAFHLGVRSSNLEQSREGTLEGLPSDPWVHPESIQLSPPSAQKPDRARGLVSRGSAAKRGRERRSNGRSRCGRYYRGRRCRRTAGHDGRHSYRP